MTGVTINSPTKGRRFPRGVIKIQGWAEEAYDLATRIDIAIKDIRVQCRVESETRFISMG